MPAWMVPPMPGVSLLSAIFEEYGTVRVRVSSVMVSMEMLSQERNSSSVRRVSMISRDRSVLGIVMVDGS